MYERAKNDGKVNISLPVLSRPILPEEIFKNTYHFDFLVDENILKRLGKRRAARYELI